MLLWVKTQGSVEVAPVSEIGMHACVQMGVCICMYVRMRLYTYTCVNVYVCFCVRLAWGVAGGTCVHIHTCADPCEWTHAVVDEEVQVGVGPGDGL